MCVREGKWENKDKIAFCMCRNVFKYMCERVEILCVCTREKERQKTLHIMCKFVCEKVKNVCVCKRECVCVWIVYKCV